MSYLKLGKFRGEKVRYSDGVGCTIWESIAGFDEGTGICFDFSEEDIDDLIKFLKQIKESEAEIYEEISESPE